MPRTFRLDPQLFLEILHSGGCRLGVRNDTLQYVRSAADPGGATIVRLHQTVTEQELAEHLSNPGIAEADFLAWHERFVALIRR